MTDDDWAALRGRLVAFATAKFGPEDAEDIAQDAIARFLTAGPGVQPGKLEAYLFRVAINEGITRWRHRTYSGRYRVERLPFQKPTGDDLTDAVEASIELADAERSLGPSTVEVLADYHDEGVAHPARRLGISEGELRVLVHHARRVVRGTPRRDSQWRVARLRRLAEAVA